MIELRLLALVRSIASEATVRDVFEPHFADVLAEHDAEQRAAQKLALRFSGFVGLGRLLAALGARELRRSVASAPLIVLSMLAAMACGIALIARTSPELARLQALWAAVALSAFALGACLPPRGWRLASGAIAALSGMLAAALALSSAGRFVDIGIPIAPLEIAKPLLVVALVGCLARRSWLALLPGAALCLALAPEPLAPVAHIEGIVSGAPRALALPAIAAALGIVLLLGWLAWRSKQALVIALAALVASDVVRFVLGGAALPLVSYGGSGLFGVALAIGLAVRASRDPSATIKDAR